AVATLRAQHPEIAVLQELSDASRLVVSEPLGDLAGAWNEVPESSWGVIHDGQDELHEFAPEPPSQGWGVPNGDARRSEVWSNAPVTSAPTRQADSSPERAGIVLVSLIAVATVANLNLSVANVAIPEIGDHFDSSQTMLNLIAVGFSFGLAASVLWFGAL